MMLTKEKRLNKDPFKLNGEVVGLPVQQQHRPNKQYLEEQGCIQVTTVRK